MRMSRMPASVISFTIKSIAGVSMSGNISLGMVLDPGRNRVPYPAARMTPFMRGSLVRCMAAPPCFVAAFSCSTVLVAAGVALRCRGGCRTRLGLAQIHVAIVRLRGGLGVVRVNLETEHRFLLRGLAEQPDVILQHVAPLFQPRSEWVAGFGRADDEVLGVVPLH